MESIPNCPHCHSEYTYHDGVQFVCPNCAYEWSPQNVVENEEKTVKDSNGNSVISYGVEYSCVMVIISSPDLVKGGTYTLTIGSISGSVQAE